MDVSDDPGFYALLTGSFRRAVGRPLVPEPECDAAWLQAEAPFAVLAHDGGDDPRFIYANRTALRIFGYAAAELIGTPSRFSAEAPDRAERQRLLDAVTHDGFVANYAGIRIRKDGTRFPIRDAIVWQLVDEAGLLHGQAATFAV
ncbi:MEKHLA domain-containing protein [Methylobacterium sp. 77]|uniref:MEKHLA domain-containing protein n=1 Tax=Methylobacterium sp. 77 TaxID=1101192 RepID=UPI0003739C75|nr:MEKHLA domain-containing protein [Methylobacterium sp. 77]